MKVELKQYFDYVMDNYLLPENAIFSSKMEYYKVIVNKIPEEISKIYDNRKYKIYGSCGKGTKNLFPYIAITNRDITTSTQRGIYVDFIFKSDMTGFYLSIDQGITKISEQYGNKNGKEKIKKAANYFRNQIDNLYGFSNDLVTTNSMSEDGYEVTRVIGKYYDKNNYTNDEILSDLNNIMLIYDSIYEKMDGKTYDEIIEQLDYDSKITIPSNVKVWLYSPGENAVYWDECINNNTMYIGFDKLGDLKKYTTGSDIFEAIKNIYNESNPIMNKCACDDFANAIKKGDIVIAKKGLDKLLGYGIVTSDYYYDETREKFKHTRSVDWKKIGEWINNSGTANPVKTLTEISQYPGYPEELLAIINGGENMIEKVTEWIIPANSKLYDHDGAFAKNGFIDWTQHVKYNIGDIVYIYGNAPLQRLTYVTKVEKINMSYAEKADDKEFNREIEFDKEENSFVRLRMIKQLDDERLKYDELIKHGLWGRPRRAARIPEELSRYINYVLNGDISIESFNKIYYGGPGCGKSSYVKRHYCKENGTYVRTTFYPDYTNSDFVGQLIPKYDKVKDKLIYDIQAGPFTKALELALKPENRNKNVYLIIEEINRGNAAAIFGDIFQLLDRNDVGESEFEISNYVIEKYISDKIDDISFEDIENKVKIPRNLSIIATMNTSDQNVFTLDSAFKRRWKMEYISNKFGISDESKEYDEKLGLLNVPMKNLDINWEAFVNKINKAIIDENTFGINSEDKQIGKYFVGSSDLISHEIYETGDFEEAAKLFAEKVLMYIWEDISKLEPTAWFSEDIKTFEKLLDKYKVEGVNIFSENIKTRLGSEINENQE